jgi:methylmalonyl-CoA mutase cobalamin-binding domain/chain
MIAKMGQDGLKRRAKLVATGYAEVGFDVDMATFSNATHSCTASGGE